MDMEPPTDLVDALNTCHLSYLVPKQEILHLFSPRPILLAPFSLDDLIVPVEENGGENNSLYSQFELVRGELNKEHSEHDEAQKKCIYSILQDLQELDLSDLDALKFRKPAMKYKKNGEYRKVRMSSYNSQVLESFPDVEKSNIVKPAIKMRRIKLSYERQKNFESKLKLKQRERDEKRKRLLEEAHEQRPNMVLKQARKSSYLPTDELTSRYGTELVSLIDQIGLSDADVNLSDPEFWIQSVDEADHDAILNDATLLKIHDHISALRNSEFLTVKIDVAYLLRIQNLCQNSLKRFSRLEIQDAVDMSSDLTHLFNVALNSCTLATIVMDILLTQRQEKHLFLLKYLLSVVDLVGSVIDNILVPACRLTVNDERIEWKENFQSLQRSMRVLLNQFNQYVLYNNTDEGLITRVEYLASAVIFADLNIKEKTSVVGLSSFENLKITCCDLLCTIFHTRPEQSQFILDEILANLDKLPTHKVHARQYKLQKGVSVQLVSILLIRLVQNVNPQEFQVLSDGDNRWNLMTLSPDELTKSDRTQLKLIRELFASASLDKFKHVVDVSKQISGSLLNKFIKSSEVNSKQIFEILIEDLLNVVPFPEWAGAECLLVSCMKTLMYIFESDSYSAQVQTFALEMIGSIGCKILQMKGQRELVHLDSNMSILIFDQLTTDIITCLNYLQSSSNESYNFFLLKLATITNDLLFQCKPQQGSSSSKLFRACFKFQKTLLLALKQGEVDAESRGQALESDLESSAFTAYGKILLSQELLHLYDSFLDLVLKSLDHSKIKSRTRAIRNLSLLISRESEILSLKRVSNTIKLRFADPSLQVRDAVVELVAQSISAKPDLIDQYYLLICQRMDDSSVAVRKRSLKLCREIYWGLRSSKSKKIKVAITERYLSKLEDEEDTIVEMARLALLDSWFFLSSKNEDDISMSDIEIVLDVIGKSDKNWERFQMFLSEHVLFPNSNDEKWVFAKIMRCLRSIIDKTLDFVVEQVDNVDLKEDVEKAMGFLSVIAKLDGTLISQDQLICLKPYLTDESNTGNSVCYYTLSIFRNALPELTHLKSSFVKDSQVSLLKRLTKFNSKELGEAMPCVWMLSNLQKDTARMATAALSCLKLTKPYLELANKNEFYEFDLKLLRLLFLLGNFGKFCDFTNDRGILLKAGIALGENEPVVNIFVKILFCFTNEDLNHQVRRAAVRNLLYVCSSHAKFFMSDSVLSIMDREFSSSTEIDIKGVIIQELIEFLEHEEAVNLKNTNKANSINKRKLDVSVFHGNSSTFVTDGVCASLVHRYMQPILEISLLENGGYSTLAVKFLQLVVKLGFANPRLCISYIVALESSQLYTLRSRAILMHTELFEKHESLIESSYVEGVKMAFQYRKRVSNKTYLRESFFFRTLFQVIGDSRTARRKFLLSMIKCLQFSEIDFDKYDVGRIEELKEFFVFLLNNLVAIELNSLEEVYLICHGVDKIISGVGFSLSMKITSLANDDDPLWEYVALLSQLLIMLFRYRNYLFEAYGLNEERARDFQPNKVDKDLRQTPKNVKEISLRVDDLLGLDKEDFQLISNSFVQLYNEVQEGV